MDGSARLTALASAAVFFCTVVPARGGDTGMVEQLKSSGAQSFFDARAALPRQSAAARFDTVPECTDGDEDCPLPVLSSAWRCISIRQHAALFDDNSCGGNSTACLKVGDATFRATRCCASERYDGGGYSECTAEVSLAQCEHGDCDTILRRIPLDDFQYSGTGPILVSSPQLGTVTFFRVPDDEDVDARAIDETTFRDGSFARYVRKYSRRNGGSDARYAPGLDALPAVIETEAQSYVRTEPDDDDDDDGGSDDDDDDGGSDDDDDDGDDSLGGRGGAR
jgi:hypothetical protein